MYYKPFRLLTAIICAVLLSACKKENLLQKDLVANITVPSNVHLNLTTIGDTIQEFKELKSAGVENTRLGLGAYWTDFD
ncbi:MAG: hypothetical protein ACRDE7_05290, partial [Sphingobacterium sp.]